MPTELPKKSKELLASVGILEPFEVTATRGGANNQVFVIKSEDKSVVLKHYFSDPNDPRNRAATETSFIRLAWEKGSRRIPELLAFDQDSSLAVHEFILGSSCIGIEINPDMIEQALLFLEELNQPASATFEKMMPPASEACFSLLEHLERVAFRIQRLSSNIGPTSAIAGQAAEFVKDALFPRWRELSAAVLRKAENLGIEAGSITEPGKRYISPSDFGFHNAILRSDAQLRFIDFEYAGYDDAIKIIGDFFAQPAVPVSEAFFELFADRVVALRYRDQKESEQKIALARLMLPVYKIKWCCIMLNEFLDSDLKRRQFSSAENREKLQKLQLDKALAYFRLHLKS